MCWSMYSKGRFHLVCFYCMSDNSDIQNTKYSTLSHGNVMKLEVTFALKQFWIVRRNPFAMLIRLWTCTVVHHLVWCSCRGRTTYLTSSISDETFSAEVELTDWYCYLNSYVLRLRSLFIVCCFVDVSKIWASRHRSLCLINNGCEYI